MLAWLSKFLTEILLDAVQRLAKVEKYAPSGTAGSTPELNECAKRAREAIHESALWEKLKEEELAGELFISRRSPRSSH